MTINNTLRHTNLRDQVFDVLKLRLISGDLAPGEIYSAASIANELGVSNSPVREAMLTLVNQGLLEAVRNRGFRVTPLSKKEQRNVYELRVMIEIPAMVNLAVRKELVADSYRAFHDIAAAMVDCAKASDIVAYLNHDQNFHLGLLSLLDNEQLTAIVGNLRDQSRQYGLKKLVEQGVLVKSAEEHLPILDALAQGDPTLTRTLMSNHLSHHLDVWAG